MPWNPDKNQGRYEVIFKDRPLHDFAEAAANHAGMSMNDYLQALARLMMNGKIVEILPLLLVEPGRVGAAPAPTKPPAQLPQAVNTKLIDNILDQM